MSEAVQAESTQEPVAQVDGTPEVAAEVVAPVEPLKPELDLSAKFAELKRQEKALQAEKHRVKQEQEKARKDWEGQLRADPIKHLQSLGLTPDQIAQALLGQDIEQPKEDPTAELKRQVEELKKAREEEQIAAFKQQVFAPVESDKEQYELIHGSKGGKDAYWDAVLSYFNTYGEAPDYKAMADEVEAALLEDAKKYLSFKKLAPKAPPAPAVQATPPVAPSKAKTLSSDLAADSFSKLQVSRVEKGAVRPAQSEYARYMDELRQKALALL